MVSRETWEVIRAQHRRIAIAGGPNTGKSTLANIATRHEVIHTDDFMHLEWTDVPWVLLGRIFKREDFIIEGVQVGRVLRKAQELRIIPVTACVILDTPYIELSQGQERMAKGCKKIISELTFDGIEAYR